VEWRYSSTLWSGRFTPGKRPGTGNWCLDRPAPGESLYRLSYRGPSLTPKHSSFRRKSRLLSLHQDAKISFKNAAKGKLNHNYSQSWCSWIIGTDESVANIGIHFQCTTRHSFQNINCNRNTGNLKWHDQSYLVTHSMTKLTVTCAVVNELGKPAGQTNFHLGSSESVTKFRKDFIVMGNNDRNCKHQIFNVHDKWRWLKITQNGIRTDWNGGAQNYVK
jgi:hypothetical protein